MLIARDQAIVGRPAVEMRRVMRLLYPMAHTTLALAYELGIDEVGAQSLIGDLRHAGLIEPASPGAPTVTAGERGVPDGPEAWTTTIAGTALGKARIGVPMPRTKAQALLDGVVDRAQEVNASEEWLHWVTRVVLYGSLARDEDGPVGGVDVAIWLESRYPHEQYIGRQYEMIARDGARTTSIIEAIGYAQMKLLRFVRGRSPKVDLVDHSSDRPLPPGGMIQVVYTFAREGEIDGRSAG